MRVIFITLFYTLSVAAQDSPYIYYGGIIADGIKAKYETEPYYKLRQQALYQRTMLPRLIDACIQANCVTGSDLNLLKKIEMAAKAHTKAGLLYYADENGKFYPELRAEEKLYFKQVGIPTNDSIFKTDNSSLSRNAISTLGPGVIVINVDKGDFKFVDFYKLLLHEFGHQVGVRDDQHRALDIFAHKLHDIINLKTNIINKGEYKIIHHYQFGIGVPVGTLSDQDLENYYHPHLIYKTDKYFINLSPYIFKTLIRLPQAFYISNFWLDSLRIRETEFGIIINGKMGQINSSENSISALGELEVVIDTTNLKARVNFTRLRNIRSNRNRARIVDFTLPTEISIGKNNDIEVQLELSTDKEIETCRIESTTKTQIRPEVLFPNWFNLTCNKIEKRNGIWYLNINIELPHNVAIEDIQIARIAFKLKDEFDDNYTYFRDLQTIKVNSIDLKEYSLESNYIYYTTLKGFTPDIKMIENHDFIDMDVFKNSDQSGVHSVLYFKDLQGELALLLTRFYIEEVHSIPLAPTQRMYAAEDILNDYKDSIEDGLRKYTLSIDPKKLSPTIKSFRVMAITTANRRGQIQTFFLNEANDEN